jgi:hypothetical protein
MQHVSHVMYQIRVLGQHKSRFGELVNITHNGQRALQGNCSEGNAINKVWTVAMY